MLVWRLTDTAASMQTEPIIHLFLEAFALPMGPLHILSSNQQETGDAVRSECRAKQCMGERFFSLDFQLLLSRQLLAPPCLSHLGNGTWSDPKEAGSQQHPKVTVHQRSGCLLAPKSFLKTTAPAESRPVLPQVSIPMNVSRVCSCVFKSTETAFCLC